jgi:ubiquinone/menaquinone biosynthesis C-methylase UbiE
MSVDADDRSGVARTNYATTANFQRRRRLDTYVVQRDGPELADLVASQCSGAVTVDIGCGNGRWLPATASVTSTVGIDRSEAMLRGVAAPMSACLVCADATALPLRDDVADATLMLWILYHVPKPERAIAEARRVLRPGGTLVAATNDEYPDPTYADIIERALTSCLNQPIGPWVHPLEFHTDNGAQLLQRTLDDVAAHRWTTTIELTDSAPLVEALDSIRGPVELTVGAPLPWQDVLSETTRLADDHIAGNGHLRFRRAGAFFIAR